MQVESNGPGDVPALAVSCTVSALDTGDTVVLNWALVAFAVTVIEAGGVTAAPLLDKPTVKPLVGADSVSVTVHVSVPEPVKDAVLQVSRSIAQRVELVPLLCR